MTFWNWRRGPGPSATQGNVAMAASGEIAPIELYTADSRIVGWIAPNGRRVTDLLATQDELHLWRPSPGALDGEALPQINPEALPGQSHGPASRNAQPGALTAPTTVSPELARDDADEAPGLPDDGDRCENEGGQDDGADRTSQHRTLLDGPIVRRSVCLHADRAS